MTSTDDNLIEIRELRFAHGPRVIFDGIDLSVPRGKVTAIMGPSGTGKTTLLRLIGGQIAPDAGAIKVDGLDVTGLDNKGLYALRRRIGMLFQGGALRKHATKATPCVDVVFISGSSTSNRYLTPKRDSW